MIPKLRFPEFEDDYTKETLGAVSKDISYGIGAAAKPYDFEYRYLRITDIDESSFTNLTDGNSVSPNCSQREAKEYILDKGDVVLARTGASVGKMFLNTKYENLVYAGFLIRFKVNSKALPYYLTTSLQTQRYNKWVSIMSVRSGQPGINAKEYSRYPLNLPSLQEQKRVSSLFASLDQKINLLTKKKEALETYKKGLMQKIFSQELRFKREDGTDYPEWKTFKLSEVLIEHKKRSDGSEQVHSVSVHKGVVNQIEHLGRSFAAKDVSNYNKVLFGDIIYTKSPTGDFPYGIIKQSYVERAIVSPLYCVTSPIDINIGYLLNWFFESKINVHNYLHPIIQKGAKNTINITNTTFLSRSLSLPSDMAERQKIKDMYSSLNDNLRTLESEILKVTEFKKGLLQQMFV